MISGHNKGLILTTTTIIVSLVAIGVIALLTYLFLSKYLDVNVFVKSLTSDRHAMNLVNILISNENLAYIKDGIIQRGVLDATKIDNVDPRMLGIGYPNTLSIVEVIDVEDCKNQIQAATSVGGVSNKPTCKAWIFVLSSPISIPSLSITSLVKCLGENINAGNWEELFRYTGGQTPDGSIGGLEATVWQPLDIEKCMASTTPLGQPSFFSSSAIVFRGLPTLIRYADGSIHIGRIIVGVGEWT